MFSCPHLPATHTVLRGGAVALPGAAGHLTLGALLSGPILPCRLLEGAVALPLSVPAGALALGGLLDAPRWLHTAWGYFSQFPAPAGPRRGQAGTVRVGQDGRRCLPHRLTRSLQACLSHAVSPSARGMCPGGGDPRTPPQSQGVSLQGPSVHRRVPKRLTWRSLHRGLPLKPWLALCWMWASPVVQAVQPLKTLPFPQAWPDHGPPRARQVGLVDMEGWWTLGPPGSLESGRAQRLAQTPGADCGLVLGPQGACLPALTPG